MLEPPTEEELEYYRTALDPIGQTMDRAAWVVREDNGAYRLQGDA